MTTTKTYSLRQVLIGWIVNNNPSAVRQTLINNSLISSSANPSKLEMARILNSYGISNGSEALYLILKQVPVNPNTSESQKMALANSYAEIASSKSGIPVPLYGSNARVGEQSANKWWNDALDVAKDLLLGGSTTTQPPTVTTTTTTSPLAIGGLIAGVLLVLGIAYFLIGRRGVA